MAPSLVPRDASSGIKRKIKHKEMIADAILSSPEGKATINEIIFYLGENYAETLPGELSATWHSTVRQTLSRDPCFIRLKRRKGSRHSEWIFFPYPRQGAGPYYCLSERAWKEALSEVGAYREFIVK